MRAKLIHLHGNDATERNGYNVNRFLSITIDYVPNAGRNPFEVVFLALQRSLCRSGMSGQIDKQQMIILAECLHLLPPSARATSGSMNHEHPLGILLVTAMYFVMK